MKDHEAEARELAASLEPTVKAAMNEAYICGKRDGHKGIDSRLDILRTNHSNAALTDEAFRKIVGDVLSHIKTFPNQNEVS